VSSKKSPFGLRLPDEVRNWLTARAKGNERSMNSEIVAILRHLMKAEGNVGLGTAASAATRSGFDS
jgi:plasmid stability protein